MLFSAIQAILAALPLSVSSPHQSWVFKNDLSWHSDPCHACMISGFQADASPRKTGFHARLVWNAN